MAKSKRIVVETDAVETDNGTIEVVVRELNVGEVAELVKFAAIHLDKLGSGLENPAAMGDLFNQFAPEIQALLDDHSVQCPIPFKDLDVSDAMTIYEEWGVLNKRFLDVAKTRIAQAQQTLGLTTGTDSVTASDANA